MCKSLNICKKQNNITLEFFVTLKYLKTIICYTINILCINRLKKKKIMLKIIYIRKVIKCFIQRCNFCSILLNKILSDMWPL